MNWIVKVIKKNDLDTMFYSAIVLAIFCGLIIYVVAGIKAIHHI